MPQRNGQNPIRAARSTGQSGITSNTPANTPGKTNGSAGTCPACKTEVPFKPGFRVSALKCPKCGTPLGRK